jgi:hypothetical protein
MVSQVVKKSGMKTVLQNRWFVLVLTLVLLSGSTGFSRNKRKIKQLTPTSKGSTGLFNLYLAETLREGEFSFGFSSTHVNREPGDLDFTLFPVSFTVGLHDRLELFVSWESHRRVHADAIRTHKVAPGTPIVPARLENLDGTTAYFNDVPFLDVGFGAGSGQLWSGAKINLLSETKRAPLSLGLQATFKFPLSESRGRLLRGLTNGAFEGGFDLILSKHFPGSSTLTANSGLMFVDDSEDVNLQNRLNYGIGYQLPFATSKVELIGEVVGSLFFGGRTGIANPKSPLDFQVGLRTFPARWISISGAYSATLRSIDPSLPVYLIQSTDSSGWFAQLAIHRKINQPPTVQCDPGTASLREGDVVAVRALIADPDDDLLALTWTASNGRISVQDSTGVFDSSDLDAGRYTVIAEVSDGENVDSCSAVISVATRRMPPRQPAGQAK